MTETYDIICIGSTSQDIFFPTDEGTIIDTPEDLTSKQKIAFEVGGKYRVTDRYEAPGGVAANVASGLARQGLGVACYSRVGQDALGTWLKQELEKGGVSTNCLLSDAAVKTDLSAIIVMEKTGERTIFHNRDANEKLEILEDKLLPAAWFFLSALNGEWQVKLKKILTLKKKGNVRLAFNPGQHNIRENPELLRMLLPEADILILNKDEALELIMGEQKENDAAGLDDERELLRRLHALGAQIIGLTDGKRGAWASDGKQILYAEADASQTVKDATGAGDAFSSGFFGALYQNAPLAQALQYGVANARSVIGFYGAVVGLLDEPALRQNASVIETTPVAPDTSAGV